MGNDQDQSPRSVNGQLTECGGICPTDLLPVCFADGCRIDPLRRFQQVLKWMIGREHDPVGADFREGMYQRRCAEMAQGGHVEIGAKVFDHCLLRGVVVRLGHPLGCDCRYATDRAGAPSQMPKDDVELRAFVE
jgi:hypothetical protein